MNPAVPAPIRADRTDEAVRAAINAIQRVYGLAATDEQILAALNAAITYASPLPPAPAAKGV